MSSGVYALLDDSNTVRYVGQSSNIEKRFSFHKSVRKWPSKWMLLHKSYDLTDRLIQEREWVRVFGGHLEGHFLENKTKGGAQDNFSILPSTRNLISNSSLLNWRDKEWKEKQCKLIKNGINKKSKEERSLIAANRWKNPITAASIKESLKKAASSEEYRKKKRDISNKIFADPAMRKKLSDAQKRRWSNPLEIERASKLMKSRMMGIHKKGDSNEQ